MGGRLWCDDEWEHRREAQRDFERSGRYDRERYDGRYEDECNRVYAEEFDRQRREADRCAEAEEERADRARADRLAQQTREEEWDQDQRAPEYPEHPEYPEQSMPGEGT